MKIHKALIIVSLLFSVNLFAQNDLADSSSDNAILSALVNSNWKGEGVLMGAKATFAMDWQYVLQNQFLKLEFQNTRKTEANEDIVFIATAYYKTINDTLITGHWFDNRGVSFPLEGTLKDKELLIQWGSAETEMGKTIYRYIKHNTITVEDYIWSKGNYHKFGSGIYNPTK